MPNPLLVIAQPLILLAGAVIFFPITVVKLALAQDWGALTSLRAFQDAWFGNMWKVFAPRVREAHEGRIVPLLQGKVRAGIKVPTAKHAPVSGTVIEVGPGTGNWVPCFAESAAGGKVDRVYGVEPNPDLHPGLLASVKKAGLQGKYEVVPVGIEDLRKASIPKGSIDSIVTLLCLCSIPEPERNIRELYEYLRPGGHCVSLVRAKRAKDPESRLAPHDGRLRPMPQHGGEAAQGWPMEHCRHCQPLRRAVVLPRAPHHGRPDEKGLKHGQRVSEEMYPYPSSGHPALTAGYGGGGKK
ncbi:hypothetical protein A1Q1_04315 [Trichosporon asahii var. asahii CBS 2479]|uniref:Methyltransferase type 11 domain-containing protein n=1 Tax=Trichosporon asahii var. asahii (strain ATCC 90039 / CBS 2479 / JCM 2466 / KCTC 7840 / NBRC 103889/ NCYC 2677 / UAMH 7654) TaxID=1186058 RepID=J5QEB6_TRIAS|nr:hypothetical protein A1Q1_04315 [Trichosporon asahii var. asahii CBS 2479]EJT46923.1 hypothetical protein A1Q1_04315 [Trichosporon asahii var. asahii CBS 2479]